MKDLLFPNSEYTLPSASRSAAMFERYTEKARRVIFFARYEASEFGCPYIETEHLLLGVVREDPFISRRLLPNTTLESLHKEIESRTTTYKKIATSVDMPLSNESKRVLACAAEEAERLGHKHIGSEHLLLGLLRERRSLAADLLASQGVRLEEARASVADIFLDDGRAVKQVAHQVQIHDEVWDLDSLRPQIRALSRFAWRKQQWKPMDILVEKDTGRTFFDLSLKDDPQFEQRSGGWQEGYCEICRWQLNATLGPEHSTGYTNGRDWVCEECYSKFLSAAPPVSPPEAP